MEPDVMVLVFWMLSFKPIFSLSSFTFIKKILADDTHPIPENRALLQAILKGIYS